MPCEPQLEVAAHVWPLGGENAVHHRVARRAVAPGLVVTEDAVLPRPEAGDGTL